jgi:DNA gyrase subunit B
MEGDTLAFRSQRIFFAETSHNLKRLSSVIPVALLEQAAIAGVLTPDAVRATAAAPDFATRLNAVSLTDGARLGGQRG